MSPKKKVYLLTSLLSILIIIGWLATLHYSLSLNSSNSSSESLNLKQSWQNISKVIHEFKITPDANDLKSYNPQSSNFHLTPGQLEETLKDVHIIIQNNSSTSASNTPPITPLTNNENN